MATVGDLEKAILKKHMINDFDSLLANARKRSEDKKITNILILLNVFVLGIILGSFLKR